MPWGIKRHQSSEWIWDNREMQGSVSAVRDAKPVERASRTTEGVGTCPPTPAATSYPIEKIPPLVKTSLEHHFQKSFKNQFLNQLSTLLYIFSMFSKCGASESHPTSLHMTFDCIIRQIHFQRVKTDTKTVLLVLKAISSHPKMFLVMISYII